MKPNKLRLMNANRKRRTARVYIHPTATHAPDLIRRVERKTGRKAVLIDGVPVLVSPADANKYLPTGN